MSLNGQFDGNMPDMTLPIGEVEPTPSSTPSAEPQAPPNAASPEDGLS